MTKHKTNKLIKRTTLAVMLTSALLSGCSEKSMESYNVQRRETMFLSSKLMQPLLSTKMQFKKGLMLLSHASS